MWQPPKPTERPGWKYLHSWVVTVDHKKLGIMYMLYALIFLVVAGIEALMIRMQLFFPAQSFRQSPRLLIACSRCTEPRWCSWWPCRCCLDSATTLCR